MNLDNIHNNNNPNPSGRTCKPTSQRPINMVLPSGKNSQRQVSKNSSTQQSPARSNRTVGKSINNLEIHKDDLDAQSQSTSKSINRHEVPDPTNKSISKRSEPNADPINKLLPSGKNSQRQVSKNSSTQQSPARSNRTVGKSINNLEIHKDDLDAQSQSTSKSINRHEVPDPTNKSISKRSEPNAHNHPPVSTKSQQSIRNSQVSGKELKKLLDEEEIRADERRRVVDIMMDDRLSAKPDTKQMNEQEMREKLGNFL